MKQLSHISCFAFRYLIDVDVDLYSDDHWIPFYLFCTPCLLNYDIIAKVETMLQDQVYVIWAAGLRGLIQPRWRHKTYHADGKEISKRYFSQLSKQEVKRLYEKYKLDFELFDYKVDDYLQYATAE
jgi:chondroitin 4-sulfotransferase 11